MAARSFETPGPMWSNDAEMSVLGSLILAAKDTESVFGILPDEAFYVAAHGTMFRTMRRVFESGRVLDALTIKNALVEDGELENTGGVDYILQLSEFVPSTLNAIYYAEIVREKYDLRMMESAARRIAMACREGKLGEAVIVAENLTEGLYTRSNIISAESVMAEAKEGLSQGVPLFLPSINRHFKSGGLGRGLFHGYCAQSGKGKSTFLCQSASYFLELGLRVAVVSLEMTASDLIIKMLTQMTGFYSEEHAARTSADAHDEYLLAHAKIRSWLDCGDLAIMDESDDGATANQVFGWMNAQVRKNGAEVVLVDYVQDIQPETGTKEDFSFHHKLSRRFKEWAKSTRTVVIGLFQIDFDGKEIKFKGGDRYRRDLATILVKTFGKADESGYRDEFLVVFKNRYGGLGRQQVFYNPRYDRVSEWEGG